MIGGTRTLGLSAVTGSDLRALQARLAADPALRRRFADLYEGDAPPEINEQNWRAYWCAASALSASAFAACSGHSRGINLLTRRGVIAAAAVIIGAAALCAIVIRRKLRPGN
jgi:hypothetical protein